MRWHDTANTYATINITASVSGDISVNGVSLGASVVAEGDVRQAIDFASLIGVNIKQVGEDIQWLSQRIDDVVCFCRGDLNLKLTMCLLQGQDYDTCHDAALNPTLHADVGLGFKRWARVRPQAPK